MSPSLPSANDASFHVLLEGSGSPNVRSSCSLVLDGDAVIVVASGGNVDPAQFCEAIMGGTP